MKNLGSTAKYPYSNRESETETLKYMLAQLVIVETYSGRLTELANVK